MVFPPQILQQHLHHHPCLSTHRVLLPFVEQKVFRPGLNPLDVHLLVSSFCYYRVSNRYTVGESFQVDLSDPQVKQRQREMICDSVLRYLQA